MAKTYDDYQKIASAILGKVSINANDYKKMMAIPTQDFTPEQQYIFSWYFEGLNARLIEIIDNEGNDDFLD